MTLTRTIAIIFMMFRGTVFNTLNRGLTAASYRHEIVAENISNISTPGYKRRDLNFRELMKRNMDSPLSAIRTDEKHFDFGAGQTVKELFVTHPNDTDIRSNGNNVDIDKEMVNMAENSIYYNSLITLLNKKYGVIKSVIAGRV